MNSTLTVTIQDILSSSFDVEIFQKRSINYFLYLIYSIKILIFIMKMTISHIKLRRI